MTATALSYLTVQDILWLNLQVTKQSNTFDFAKLEEATFYQYGYGSSQDLFAQAARFLKGFVAMNPFAGKGDAVTAFLGCAAFLSLNGYDIGIPSAEAKGWLERIAVGQVDASNAIAQLAQPHGRHETTEACLKGVVAAYGPALS